MKRGVTEVKAEEIRKKLMAELNAELSAARSTTSISYAPDEPIVTFPSPSFEKPKMFEPSKIGNENFINDKLVKGIAFKTSKAESAKKQKTDEIYSMKEFINSNPANMSTFSYDEKIMKKQLALVKKKEWQDILFEDIDWSMQIDLVSPIKKFFGGIKF